MRESYDQSPLLPIMFQNNKDWNENEKVAVIVEGELTDHVPE